MLDRGRELDGGRAWEVSRGRERIVVVFRGHVSEEDGHASARAFLAALGESRAVELVFDVRDVQGYTGRARQAWQGLLLPRRRQIRSLGVLSRSRLTRMGASVFALMLGVDCRFYDEIPAEVSA